MTQFDWDNLIDRVNEMRIPRIPNAGPKNTRALLRQVMKDFIAGGLMIVTDVTSSDDKELLRIQTVIQKEPFKSTIVYVRPRPN